MEIDLNEWKLSGDGKEGESYVKKDDNTKLLKLYHEQFNFEEAEHELSLAKLVYALGLPTPVPGDMVSCGKRKGVIFNNIPNKRSLCRVISQQPERLKEMAELLAKMSRDMHTRKVELPEGAKLDDYRVAMTRQCEELKSKLPESVKEGIEKTLKNAPAPDCFNHGDFHFGNVITDEKNNYFIDLGRFKLGTADYDLSTLYFVCFMVPGKVMKSTFHIKVSQARKFWEEFINAYYGAEAQNHIETIRKWALLKAELICVTLGYNPIAFYLLTGNFKAIKDRKNI